MMAAQPELAIALVQQQAVEKFHRRPVDGLQTRTVASDHGIPSIEAVAAPCNASRFSLCRISLRFRSSSARFTTALKGLLEQPEALLLELV